MGSVKLLIIAVVATLTPLLALAPESDGASSGAPQPLTVVCKDQEASVTVSAPNSTVNFVCPSGFTFDPAVTEEQGKPKVCSDTSCREMEPLTSYCPDATLEAAEIAKPGLSQPVKTLKVPEPPAGKADEPVQQEVKNPAATLHVPQLPAEQRVFYVQCKPPKVKKTSKEEMAEAQAPCVVKVTVNQAPNKGETGGAGQAGGVHVCKQPSITVNVPDKNSSVQFSCENKFTLYPTDLARVFKDDCKTEEPLKDMRRTTPAAASAPGAAAGGSPPLGVAEPPVYTLKAVEKPAKRKLCYLCAKQKPADRLPKPPEDYCAIYVESSARAPSGLNSTPLALVILSSVLAVLRLT